MKNFKFGIIAGILLTVLGLFCMTLKIDNPMHYFGTGSAFGFGVCMLLLTLYKNYGLNNKKNND